MPVDTRGRGGAVRAVVAVLRVALAALVLAAVAASYVDTWKRIGGPPNPFNFFGYFTIQSNLLGAAVLVLSASALLRGAPRGGLVPLLRAAATTYVVVVGAVYALLLAPLGDIGGISVEWANTVLHIAAPILLPLDWILAPERAPIPWSRLWALLVYPAVWIAVVLARGATDGWVPYPFLAPENGAPAVFAVCAGIAATILGVGALVFAIGRIRLRSRKPRARGSRSREPRSRGSRSRGSRSRGSRSREPRAAGSRFREPGTR
ncbi:Pr6Pr family membrane protein [Leucobacter sp. CSA1]|uniref:Pr6Pr family membrane protein n=1 Tax=Leucobacter chromiisoli TaxID=2796471 RepID=A0A934Q685_9MICO|nr:Pr6Pr family membrane protein [Leucobacter chromiisoli]MBK0418421.1 Pr6Pr family membrane protein [Leucobacter chromiisoli]